MTLLPTFCAILLGITIGIVFNHRSELNKLPEATEVTPQLQPINIYTNLEPPSARTPLPSTIHPRIPSRNQKQGEDSTNTIATILNKQATLQRQLMEQSKELQTLAFIVDTHSSSFVPLRKESDNLPPSRNIAPSDNTTLILPPK